MRKVTCISYHGTGSSAVDDYLKEFDNTYFGPLEVELRFLQDPDGISDLEYNLVENPQRLNSGFAIKRYENYTKVLNRSYSYIFGKNWKKYSKEYINKLMKFTYEGYWHGDLWLLPKPVYYFYKFRRLINKFVPKAIKKSNDYNYFPSIKTYHTSISEEEFLKLTKQYVENLCNSIVKKKDGFAVLEQMVPTMNIQRYLRYVDDMKIIIIDRDPRDTYLVHQRAKDHVLAKDPYKFCETFIDYRRTIEKECEDTEHVLRIQFEDLVYHYEETFQKITEFIGIDEKHHVKHKKCFDPSISINNMNLWEKMPEYDKEVEIITSKLGNYLYQKHS